MEQFVVSARKYRPASFRSVVGQLAITSTLQNAIKNNHLAQAFLFCGPRGVGKTTCARILAKTINCLNITSEYEACNECDSCKAFNESSSFNIHELDAASNNSVDDIRSLVDQVRFAPQIGKYNIYIIDEVHMLSTAAFNAFLKTLEEPPAHAIFILATTERHKILPTILSRCQVFVFNRITVDDMAKHLEYVATSENIKADPDALHIVAQKADGALRDALSMFDQIVSFAGGNEITYEGVIENLNILDYDYYFRVTDHLLNGSYTHALVTFDEILRKGFDGGNFIAGLSEHFRNLLMCKDMVTINLLETSANVKSRYQTQAQACNPLHLIKALEALNKADIAYKSSRNQRLTVELGLLQVYQVLASKMIETEAANQMSAAAKPAPTPEKPAAIEHAVPPPAAVPVSRKLDSLNFNMVSIKSKPTASDAFAPSSTQSEKSNDASFEVTDLTQSKVTDEMLQFVWNKYALKLQNEGNKLLATALTHTRPKLVNEHIIEYELQNQVQLNDLNEHKIEMQGFFRKELSNSRVKFNFTVAEAPIKTRPFTIDEKLKFFEERNASFAILKHRFGLSVE